MRDLDRKTDEYRNNLPPCSTSPRTLTLGNSASYGFPRWIIVSMVVIGMMAFFATCVSVATLATLVRLPDGNPVKMGKIT